MITIVFLSVFDIALKFVVSIILILKKNRLDIGKLHEGHTIGELRCMTYSNFNIVSGPGCEMGNLHPLKSSLV